LPEINPHDPAHRVLPLAVIRHIAAIADEVVHLYGAGGPPFPITGLMALLMPSTKVEFAEGYHLGVYGYAHALDWERHRKFAAIWVDTTAPTEQVFTTLFHEAGHALLHLVPDSAPVALTYFRQSGPLALDQAQAEAAADLFARLVMMPAAWMREKWPYACTYTHNPGEAIAFMALLFHVPADWMADRLQALGLIRS
jgi:hypothetical protein